MALSVASVGVVRATAGYALEALTRYPVGFPQTGFRDTSEEAKDRTIEDGYRALRGRSALGRRI